jgi:hypothetical protein
LNWPCAWPEIGRSRLACAAPGWPSRPLYFSLRLHHAVFENSQVFVVALPAISQEDIANCRLDGGHQLAIIEVDGRVLRFEGYAQALLERAWIFALEARIALGHLDGVALAEFCQLVDPALPCRVLACEGLADGRLPDEALVYRAAAALHCEGRLETGVLALTRARALT